MLAIVLRGVPAEGEELLTPSNGAPLSQACAKEVTVSTGSPYMFPAKGPLQFGLSAGPGPFLKSVPMAIWISNVSQEEQSVWTCEDLGYFMVSGFDVLDQKGVRVMSHAEMTSAKYSGGLGRDYKKCLRNFRIHIPPHSCVHGDLLNPTFDFVKDLAVFYTLPAGHYEITPRTKEGSLRPPQKGMAIEIAQ